MKPELIQRVIIGLSIVGLLISVYSFLHNRGFADGSFCTLGETINCDIVNKGPYSTIVGIPVAMLGILGYGFILIAALLKERRFLFISSLGGLLFSLYLTALEAFFLPPLCFFC